MLGDYRAKDLGRLSSLSGNLITLALVPSLLPGALGGAEMSGQKRHIGMPNRNKRDLFVASARPRGKQGKAALPNINVCGDIGLAIARDGTWFYEGSPIQRMPLVKLFASVLHREGEDYYLVTPVEKVLIAVEGLPFVAVAMELQGSGKTQRLTFRTNVDDEVTAGPRHPLGFEEGEGGPVPFVEVRDGLRARLARTVYYELAALAVEAPKRKGLGVWSGGSFFLFPDIGADL